MSYIGNKPATSFETVQKQISTSNSGTTITLDRAVTSVQDILLTIDAVVQSYDNYSVSGTTLTVGGTLNNNRVEILYVGRTMQSVDPTDNSVSTAKIQNDAVTKDKVDFVTDSGGASLEAKGSSGYDGAVRLNCSVNSHFTELKSASHGSYSGNLSFTLPSSTGTNGQFLQTNGSGVLSFANAPSGGLQFITGSSSSSSHGNITFDNIFSSSYRNYIVIGDFTPATNNADIELRFRDSGGDQSASEYQQHLTRYNADSDSRNTKRTDGVNSFRFSTVGLNNDTARVGLSFHMVFWNPNDSNVRGKFYVTGAGVDNGAQGFQFNGMGQYKGTSAHTGLKFFPASGNFSVSNVKVYGVVDS